MSSRSRIPVISAEATITLEQIKIGTIVFNAAGGAFAALLPNMGDDNDGLELLIKSASTSGANGVTLASASDTINGGASYTLAGANDAALLRYVAALSDWIAVVSV